jgi:hypothetical protein
MTLGPAFAILPITVCSSYGSPSLVSISIAPSGQSPMQAPKPSQNKSLTTLAFPSINCKAPSGHPVTQLPQPVHFSSSIRITSLFTPIHPYLLIY